MNVITGEITELPDAPVTWVEPVDLPIVQPTIADLMLELQALTTKINALGAV